MTDGNSTYPTADPGYTSTDTADTEVSFTDDTADTGVASTDDTADTEVAFTDDAADTQVSFTDDAADTEIAFTDDAADTDVDFTNGAVDADFDPNLLPADPNTTDLEDLIEIWPGPRPSFLFPSPPLEAIETMHVHPDESIHVFLSGLPLDCGYEQLFGALRDTGKIYKCLIYPTNPQSRFVVASHGFPLARGMPPSDHSRVFMITGPIEIIDEGIVNSILNLETRSRISSVRILGQNYGIGSMVYSFTNVSSAKQAWVSILDRLERAYAIKREMRADLIWGNVHLTPLIDPCQPLLRYDQRERRKTI
ncbi:hypothetical protein F4824DRAFT_505310 [Ustulina deusta]|nr:hypothetical protein F4824DRAFT_505310 [Ustulina deusta]